MKSVVHHGHGPGIPMAQQFAEEDAVWKKRAREDAECQRKSTQKRVDKMAGGSTPECRIAAAKARAWAVYAKIDDIAAQGDLEAVQQAPLVQVDMRSVRIDDFDALFGHRDDLAPWLHDRIKKIYAKLHWQTRTGRKGFFNEAVSKNHIPIDQALTILAHLHDIEDGTGRSLDRWIDSVIECGLFPKIKQGKFQYSHRCQDGEHCELCNYLNISDGVKTLVAGYDESAFYRGGNWLAFTVALRIDPAQAKAIGRIITPEDWHHDNPDSIVFRESFCGRVFRYADPSKSDQFDDFAVEEDIRRFLGAVQTTFGKLVKNGWLDGIRAKVENSIEFLPFASHQHWHAVGSSVCEHDPQAMAEFVQEEVNAILAKTCPGLYADVMVAAIPSPEDLTRWVKYINKTTKLVEPVISVYNRHPGLRRDDPIFEQFIEELRLYPQRSRRVFAMARHSLKKRGGSHTYMLRRRYVRGRHKFGKGSVLSESERHRLWRTRHAQQVSDRRKGTKAEKNQEGERASPAHARPQSQRPRKAPEVARNRSKKVRAPARRVRPSKAKPLRAVARSKSGRALPPHPPPVPRHPPSGLPSGATCTRCKPGRCERPP